MYKVSHILLLIIVCFTACTTDDLPCNGNARDIIYDLDAEDSANIPMLNINEQKYLHTLKNVKDTVKITRVSVDKTPRVLFIEESGECPTVFWENKLIIKYEDSNSGLTPEHIFQANSEGVPNYFYNHDKDLTFSLPFYPENYKNSPYYLPKFSVQGQDFYHVMAAYSSNYAGMVYYNNTYGIIRVEKGSNEIWQLLLP